MQSASFTPVREKNANVKLTPSAVEFVPSGVVVGGSTNAGFGSMNATASEWRPQSASLESPDPLLVDSVPELSYAEVNYGDGSFYVPDDVAEAYQTTMPGMLPTPADELASTNMDWNTGIPSMMPTTVPAPTKRTLQTIGIPEPIRKHFQNLDFETLQQIAPDDDRYKEIPPRYHSIFALDTNEAARSTGGSFGYPSALYKVTDRMDSQVYALRRFDNVKTTQSIAKNAQDKWSSMRHPSIVSLYSISPEKGAVFFSYAYHPMAVTLRERFIEQRGPLLTESILWRILTQLFMGMRASHARGLALRAVDVNHVLLTSGSRFRFGGVGIPDVLDFESRKTPTELQIEDMIKFGIMMLSVAARNMITAKSIDQGKAVLQQHYSDELNQVVDALLSGKEGVPKISAMIAENICDELDVGLASFDALHNHLRSEYENSRITRLLLKLGFINERPEHSGTPAWSETGDRYILKLFRDYLFHQRLPDGTPVLDCGHIISSLNKLDAADDEQIIMSSRNGKDLLVASFSDIHRCLEETFIELARMSDPKSVVGNPNYIPSGSVGMGVDPYLAPLSEPRAYPSARSGGIQDMFGPKYGEYLYNPSGMGGVGIAGRGSGGMGGGRSRGRGRGRGGRQSRGGGGRY